MVVRRLVDMVRRVWRRLSGFDVRTVTGEGIESRRGGGIRVGVLPQLHLSGEEDCGEDDIL